MSAAATSPDPGPVGLPGDPQTQAAWAVGDYALVRRRAQQARRAGGAAAAPAQQALRRLQLDPWTLRAGLGSTALLLAAWIYGLLAGG